MDQIWILWKPVKILFDKQVPQKNKTNIKKIKIKKIGNFSLYSWILIDS